MSTIVSRNSKVIQVRVCVTQHGEVKLRQDDGIDIIGREVEENYQKAIEKVDVDSVLNEVQKGVETPHEVGFITLSLNHNSNSQVHIFEQYRNN